MCEYRQCRFGTIDSQGKYRKHYVQLYSNQLLVINPDGTLTMMIGLLLFWKRKIFQTSQSKVGWNEWDANFLYCEPQFTAPNLKVAYVHHTYWISHDKRRHSNFWFRFQVFGNCYPEGAKVSLDVKLCTRSSRSDDVDQSKKILPNKFGCGDHEFNSFGSAEDSDKSLANLKILTFGAFALEPKAL